MSAAMLEKFRELLAACNLVELEATAQELERLCHPHSLVLPAARLRNIARIARECRELDAATSPQ